MAKEQTYVQYQIIEEFLKRYEKRDKDGTIRKNPTITTYRAILKHYFKELKIKDVEGYFNNKRNYEKDVETYATSMNGDDTPAKTFANRLAAVKKFLHRNDIDFKPEFWEDIKTPKIGYRQAAYPTKDDKIPTNEEIKMILTHGDILEKSFFTVLCSSGIRVGELCKIKISDVDLDFQPAAKIEIRAIIAKGGKRKRTTFMSDEARMFTVEWLKVRDEWLHNAAVKTNIRHKVTHERVIKKTDDEDRLFPMNPNTARIKWERMINKASDKKNRLNEKDHTIANHLRLHPHCLRKFFRIRLPDKIGVDLTEGLMGHGSGLTMTYRKYGDDKKKLAADYAKGMSEVNIFEHSPDLSGITLQLEEQEKINAIKDERIQKLETEVDNLRALFSMQRKFEQMIKAEINAKIGEKVKPDRDR